MNFRNQLLKTVTKFRFNFSQFGGFFGLHFTSLLFIPGILKKLLIDFDDCRVLE